ncbi:hypothetical protein J2S08_004027 [Bacillus chungangensis]|uniref:DUF5626 domain-containing protein n=1 Tax=Bacillus chungangensis TaxID=587633 RepID=A0ABT9WY06_9BACI|nr:hypothetical protein [Bacillus chungangensis]
MSFYIDVNVPRSNINNSKITKAYDPDHWMIGGSLSDTSLTYSNKTAKYSANASWLGGMGGSSVWVKATLNENVLTTSSRF